MKKNASVHKASDNDRSTEERIKQLKKEQSASAISAAAHPEIVSLTRSRCDFNMMPSKAKQAKWIPPAPPPVPSSRLRTTGDDDLQQGRHNSRRFDN